MRLAVVDDLEEDALALSRLISQYLCHRNIEQEISVYKSCEDFLSDYISQKFDVIFLDIYTNDKNGLNGMKTAKRLREEKQDCLIIFTTISQTHAVEGYRVRAFHYLVKPYSMELFYEVMDLILTALKINCQFIELKQGKIIVKILTSEIYFAEMDKHYLKLITKNGIIKSRIFFKDFSNKLKNQSQFLVCYRNVIVNMDMVEVFEGKNFVLKNGERVPVQNKLAMKVKQVFADYLFEKAKRGGKNEFKQGD